MRLTLRTMLNYMDGILDPADAEVVAAKIEASPFAAELMQRMHEVVKRLRLAAPKLDGRGMGLDANTVAEYLDNTLHGDRVPDFEKVCLESDVHLAEVVACHQILALVLGEPADVDLRARQRMYALVNGAEGAAPGEGAVASGAATSAAPAAEEPLVPARKRPEIPDYLRDSATAERSRRGSRLATVVVMLLLAIVVGGGVGALLAYPDLIRNLLAPTVAQGPTDSVADAGKPLVAPVDEAPGPAVEQPPTPTEPTVEPGAEPVVEPAVPVNERPAMPAEPPPPATPAAELQQPPAADTPAPTPPTADMPPATDTAASPPMLPPLPDTAPLPEPPATPTGPPEEPAQPAAPEGIGRKIADQNVMLRFDQANRHWVRLPERGVLMPGDELLGLPGYRSKLVFAAGVTIDALGGSFVEMLGPDEQGVPGMRVTRGRLIVASTGAPNTRFRLASPDFSGTMTFNGADAILAIDVHRPRADGVDPEKADTPVAFHLYVTGGEVIWTPDAGQPNDPIRGPAALSIDPTSALARRDADAPEFPTWITTDDRRSTERLAVAAIEQTMRDERPITLVLKELVGDRRGEVSLLAVQCLAQLGEFDDLPPPLRDPVQRANWYLLLDTAMAALDYSPEYAARVRSAFERQGARGAEMYRMLWGYSDEQLRDGAAARLVELLDHNELDMRVVAFWTLRRITGVSLLYQPQDTEARRRQPVQKWKQRLEAGQISRQANGQ